MTSIPTPRPDMDVTSFAFEKPVSKMRASCACGDREDPDLALARLEPLRGQLDAVVYSVADDVRERVADHLDHFAIQLDVAAFDVDQHLLAELGRQIPHHPW